MPSSTWRGTVGLVKPTYDSGTLVEFVRLLPDGIGVLPVYLGLKEHTAKEYLAALDSYHEKIVDLAKKRVDLIHPEGAPPFLIRGYKVEQELVRGWEKEFNIPIATSGMTQVEAFRAMGIHRLLGVTFHDKTINDMFAGYFVEAGFDLVAIEGMPVERSRRQTISAEEIYFHIKGLFLKYSGVDGIYLQGSGTWQARDVVSLEEDLGIPVIHPVAARVWFVQKRFHIREPVKGVGRLLEQMP